MQDKKNVFSILEKIEKNKYQITMMNIKNIYLQERKNLDQLKILNNYRKEYLKKIHIEMLAGINVNYLINYNNFMRMLDKIIQENICFIENHKKIVNEHLNAIIKSQINLKTWEYLDKICKKNILKRKLRKEQMINDNNIQLQSFQKG
ncbi:flagellar export protein FliJ [Buchnera aphidicola]|uniref:Flagellar FliJ protein n=1 Tax=Buchnera aphidicola subsp. Uroleucon sonchi TaxID=118118 RepID=A0A6C1F5T0_BUCUN|nr:flagellar FliJ family protein [Buchnera aphidicola]QIE01833.1 flagellar export protein FliJ [Buchnera aphidicola (Uroleucon sonchi)]